MYLKRHIDSYLKKWKDDADKKPLIIKGARQTGKTESVLMFAKDNYDSLIEINFVREPKYKTITGNGYDVETVIKNISRIEPSARFPEGRTLLFFDEINDFPNIATTLKFFAQDGRYDVICSGSLLGISYKTIESNSVGYKTDYEMMSMDFEEYLWAMGYPEGIADEILKNMLDGAPFTPTEIETFEQHFLDYSTLGGMPAVVRDFVEKGTFEGSLSTQRQILADYREDMVKYTSGIEQARILNTFNHIPVQLGKENKKFQISKVAKGARYKDYWGCIDWLERAGIVSLCYCLAFPELPLKGNYVENKYKIYFKDTGLFLSMLDDEVQDDVRINKNLGTYKGALYESIVAEALKKSGADLFYYKKEDSTLEEDFFLRTADCLVPIEVKAGSNRSKAMRTLIDSDRYPDISYGIKLVKGNIGEANGVYTFPHFCAFLLKRYLKGDL